MSLNPEFQAIMIPAPGNRPVMSKPAPYQATMKFVREVRDELELDDDAAVKAADWILNKMERFGANTAQPMFDMDGNGPNCSWCGMIWPLCGHHHMSSNLPDDEDENEGSES